ncbi:MAG: hypothetical protein H6983_17040 [Ectothiorhodospiraceae bacterium]|nr:hypothetical protein [Ectothiorhodospiraceae bacterium]
MGFRGAVVLGVVSLVVGILVLLQGDPIPVRDMLYILVPIVAVVIAVRLGLVGDRGGAGAPSLGQSRPGTPASSVGLPESRARVLWWLGVACTMVGIGIMVQPRNVPYGELIGLAFVAVTGYLVGKSQGRF